MIDKNTGQNIADSYITKLEAVKAKLDAGLVIDNSDFIAAGISKNVISDALIKLRDTFYLDVLSIRRGHKVIGYVLAGEIL